MAAVALALAPSAGAGAISYTTPGGPTVFKVPKGVCQLSATVSGAQGGHGAGANTGALPSGGLGGRAAATFAVTKGLKLQVVVGANGGDGVDGTVGGQPSQGGAGGFPDGGPGGTASTAVTNYGGGGGGGASSLSTGGKELLVAGGGGGGGAFNSGIEDAFGGAGGGLLGGAGDPGDHTGAGLGGTQSLGGFGGAGSPNASEALGHAGTKAAGGGGGGNHQSNGGGGGGGGGHFGGGGGGGVAVGDSSAAGGGGGSGLGPKGTVFTQGVQPGNGAVVLNWGKCKINKRCSKLRKRVKAEKRAGDDAAVRKLKGKRAKLGCKRVGL